MDERLAYVDLFILILVAEGLLPPAAWDDLQALLAPPQTDPTPGAPPQIDPAPGVEFAPAEVPDAVIEEVVRPGIARLAGQFRQRAAEVRANPPAPSERDESIRRARAELMTFLRELPGFGIQIVGEVEPLDEL